MALKGLYMDSTQKRFLNKMIFALILGTISLGLYYFGMYSKQTIQQQDVVKHIGIVLPMEHAALREIVDGFKEQVTKLSSVRVEFVVQNAQGDLNLQRSIIQQFVNQKMDLIVPVGTTATQMTKALIKEQPIVSLAALPESGRPANVTGVLDEIGPYKPLDFIRVAMPQVKKITLIHSSSEKVFPDVEELVKYGKSKGIDVQTLMIQSLPELYTVSRLVDKNAQLIFILKDHMVVSGIKTIVQQAKTRHIPVVASDEGSVNEGATFGLGVREKEIGEQGGRLAVKVLTGHPIQALPIEALSTLCVFYNSSANTTSDNALLVDKSHLEENAKQLGYGFVELGL
jgi:putative ABC transport system substrate-binding protein